MRADVCLAAAAKPSGFEIGRHTEIHRHRPHGARRTGLLTPGFTVSDGRGDFLIPDFMRAHGTTQRKTGDGAQEQHAEPGPHPALRHAVFE